MEEHLEVLVQTVRDLIARDDTAKAAAVVDALHPSDLAAVLAHLGRDERASLVLAVGPARAAEAIWELEDAERERTIAWLDDSTVVGIVEALPEEGATDILQEAPAERLPGLRARLPQSRLAHIDPLFGHKETTAGGLMSPRFVAVSLGATVADVLDVLRAHRETPFVYYVYVLDGYGRPVGVTALRELIVADPGARIDDVMRVDPVTVTAATDQEQVARLASRYDLLAVPVVSSEGRMLGIVTADDVLEVLSSEADEDIERFVGSMEPEPAGAGLLDVVLGRTPWVVGTFVIEVAVAYVFLRPLPASSSRALLAFLPLLLFTGGSSAIASAGVVLRRLVRGERRPVLLLGHEVQGGLLLAVMATGASGAALLLAGQALRLAAVASISVGLTVLVSSTVGAVAPVALWGLGRDPAMASGPLLGALADAAALAVYLLAARVLL